MHRANAYTFVLFVGVILTLLDFNQTLLLLSNTAKEQIKTEKVSISSQPAVAALRRSLQSLSFSFSLCLSSLVLPWLPKYAMNHCILW